MNYYCSNIQNEIEYVTTSFDETIYQFVIADERNIPLENAKIIDGTLYDNRTNKYQLAKEIYDIDVELANGFLFEGSTFAIDMNIMEQYAMMKSLEETNPVEPVAIFDIDYNLIYLPVVKYIELCNLIVRRFKDLSVVKTTKTMLLRLEQV